MFTEISKNYAALQAHARKIDIMIRKKRFRTNSRVGRRPVYDDRPAFNPMSDWE